MTKITSYRPKMTALLKMNIAYADPEGTQPIEEVFDIEQILELMNTKLQRKSTKPQNRHDPERTKWTTWAVGRIGGVRSF